MKTTTIRLIFLAICLGILTLVFNYKNTNDTITATKENKTPIKNVELVKPIAEKPVTPLINEIPDVLPEPLWQAHDENFSPSSPRLVDLTGDGILDVVMGDIQNDGISIITAINGDSGKEIWKVSGYKDIFTSATFLKIDEDSTPDIIMGGRNIDLVAISGSTGKLLWQFEKLPEFELWGNFYSSQVIDDQNGDGVQDIVTANGGDTTRDTNRPPGLFLIISGKTGEPLRKLTTPDGQESYMSPILAGSPGSNEKFVLFGTGGETLPGSIWKISLSSLAAENADGFKKLISSKNKGYEAPPASADFNMDGIHDYVIQAFDGTATLVDGKTDTIIWEVLNEGFESVAIPTLGYFVGNDNIPDIFLQVNQGAYPEYTGCKNILIDGADGKIIWSSLFGKSSTSGSVAIDLNSDNIDEIIFAVNESNPKNGDMYARFYIFNTTDKNMALVNKSNRFAIGSPWVGDIDNNGLIDIIMEGQQDNEKKSATLNRYELKNRVPGRVSWGAYMGTSHDGQLQHR